MTSCSTASIVTRFALALASPWLVAVPGAAQAVDVGPTANPAISLSLSGTLDATSNLCGLQSAFTVPPGTDIHLCYRVDNTGDTELNQHTLTDTLFGALLTDFPYPLSPNASAYLTQFGNLGSATHDIATWTASNPAGSVALDNDSITITHSAALISCNGPTSTFSNGIPNGWTRLDALAVPSGLGDSLADWDDLAGCTEAANFTGARGGVACASSALAGTGAFDSELRTHSFSLAGQTGARLRYVLNYQNYSGIDHLDVDVSTDGGVSWTNVGQFASDVGSFRVAAGAQQSVNLNAYLGEENVRVRWRYYDLAAGAVDWYAQVDNVRLVCGDGVYFDGFESGDTHAWSASLGEP